MVVGWVKAMSQGRERRAWESRQEEKMRRGRGRRVVVCEWCGNCWQGSRIAFDNGWLLIRADAGSLLFFFFLFSFTSSVRLALSEAHYNEVK